MIRLTPIGVQDVDSRCFLRNKEENLVAFRIRGEDVDIEGPLDWSLGMRLALKSSSVELTEMQFASLLEKLSCTEDEFADKWRVHIEK